MSFMFKGFPSGSMMEIPGVYSHPDVVVGKQKEFLYEEKEEGGFVSVSSLDRFSRQFARGLVRSEPERAFPGLEPELFNGDLQPMIWLDDKLSPSECVQGSAFVLPVGVKDIPLNGDSAASVINRMVANGEMSDAKNFINTDVAGQMKRSFSSHFNLPPACVRLGLNYGGSYGDVICSVIKGGDNDVKVEFKTLLGGEKGVISLADGVEKVVGFVEGEEVVVSPCQMRVGQKLQESIMIYKRKKQAESQPLEHPLERHSQQEQIPRRELLMQNLYNVVRENPDIGQMSVIGESGEVLLVSVQVGKLDPGESVTLGRIADGRSDSGNLFLSGDQSVSRAHISVERSIRGDETEIVIKDNNSSNGVGVYDRQSLTSRKTPGIYIPDGSSLVLKLGDKNFFSVNVQGHLLVVPIPAGAGWRNFGSLEEDMLSVVFEEVGKLVARIPSIKAVRGGAYLVPHHIKGSTVTKYRQK